MSEQITAPATRIIPVDPKTVETSGRALRVTTLIVKPIIDEFLAANVPMARVDRTGIDLRLPNLYSRIYTYIQNHNLPVRVFSKSSVLYLARTDLEEEEEAKGAGSNNAQS